MSISVVVKNTFICVEDEALLSPMAEMRSRAVTIDVASLRRQGLLSPIEEDEEDEEEEEVRKCRSAPTATGARVRVASLAAGLEIGGGAATASLAEIRRSVRELAFDAAGCSLVLRALEVSCASETICMAEGLRGVVGEAARSSSACRVLEQIVRCVGSEEAAFIAEELLALSPSALVLNANGSSLLCHLIEYSAAESWTSALIDAVLSSDVAVLCGHKFGHEVAMSILSNGSSSQRARIVSTLHRDVQRFTRHRFASQVFAQALVLGSDDEEKSLAFEVLKRPGTVVALACHNFGVNIVRELLQVPSVSQEVQMLLARSGRVGRDKFGSELMREVGLSKQQPKPILDLTSALGLLVQSTYEAQVMMFAIGGV